ncbi:hypothetical protein TA3x_003848 [Tundrisphaera sp. TA3]|uniref:hypothetical protein n=1 Tax=Tundrisphaera sp. TA3 TaxID=3435775 RepID=UPI003EB96127
MRPRPALTFRPGLERFEAKLMLTAAPAVPGVVIALDSPPAPAADDGGVELFDAAAPAARNPKLQLSRITVPKNGIARLVPPLQQIKVQGKVPVPGQMYNILSVSVRNSTQRTFDASNDFRVRITGQRQSFPAIAEGDQWKPGEFRVFYIFTKQYYPLKPVTSAGFEFDFGGSRGVAIPGPSGIFQRVRYRPAKFADTLDWIVTRGPGAKGTALGLPNTAIWEVLPASAPIVPL